MLWPEIKNEHPHIKKMMTEVRKTKRGRKVDDLTGTRFGRLVVLERSEDKMYSCGTKEAQWLCICDCGKQTIVSRSNLKNGSTKSCGCLNYERICQRRVSDTHKRILRILRGMKDRCYNPNYHSFSRYGGRGITICDEWRNDSGTFEKWALEHGYSDELSIDRIDNDLGYSPENCRWVTKSIQQNNKSNNNYLEYGGQKRTVTEWANLIGVDRSTIVRRIKKGLPVEKVLENVSA